MFVHSGVVYINTNGTLKDTGRLGQFCTPFLQQQIQNMFVFYIQSEYEYAFSYEFVAWGWGTLACE